MVTTEIDNIVTDFKENFFGIEMIETDLLIVDHEYQRPVRAAQVKAISSSWDWKAVRTLAVSLRQDQGGNNYYTVIDGQQRLTAAREANINKLPCQVYIDLTKKQEAELFLKLNNSSKPNANDMFRAKIAEGDKEASLIVQACRNTNWELRLNALKGGTSKDWCSTYVASAMALTQIYRDGGILHLQSVLNIAHGWHGQHGAGSSDIILGISKFLLKYGKEISLSKLTEKLVNETPNGILGKAIQVLAAERAIQVTDSGTRSKAIVRVLVGIYNKGLRNGRLGEE